MEPALWERAVGAGPARERERSSRQDSRDLGFQVLLLRIRDAVQWWCLPGPLKPSMAAVSLALPGQTAPSRHHHCPAHWAAESPRVRNSARTFLQNPGGESPKERRDRVGPSRTVFGQGWPNAEPTDTVLPINWFGPLSSRRWCGPASHNTTGRNTDRFSVLHT